MSIQAGTLIYVGGNAVIDRLQSAGLGNTRVPTDVIREVGNPQIVDKVPQEPDFTFTLESFDVSTQLEAWLTGQHGDGTIAGAPGAGDVDGTAYHIDADHCQFLNICSPWRDPASATSDVHFGHLLPGFYPRRVRYQFGVAASAQETVELQGGSFYYQGHPPVEQYEVGDGATTAFPTDDAAVPYRVGGAGGTLFRSVFGVVVDGKLMADGVDYTSSPTNSAASAVATVTFVAAPKIGAVIRFVYFTTATKQYPQAVHASAIVKPAAVRGRNVCVYLNTGGDRIRVPMVQSASLEYTVEGAVEHEFCNQEVVGYNITGTDVTGDVVSRSRDWEQFEALLAAVTGVDPAEVIGWLNTNAIPLDIEIHNPKDPAEILKTLHVADAIFDIPDTPARVNQPTDFTFGWQSQSGTYTVYKGANPDSAISLAPVVTSADPASGPEGGATEVIITGRHFTGATAVHFGATPAAAFHVDSPTHIIATSPAGVDAVDVTVTTPAGTSGTGDADTFTFVPRPVVTGIDPDTGPAAGGTEVTVIGTDFTGATAVHFDSDVAAFHVDSPTELTAVAPAGAGTADITVTTVGGTSATSSDDEFVYV